MALPQDRREVPTVTGTSASPSGGRGADLAIFPGIGTHSSRRALERMTIGRLTLALVVAAVAVLRSAAKSPGTFPVGWRPRPFGRRHSVRDSPPSRNTAARSWCADVRRFFRLINAHEVFGTHTLRARQWQQ